MKIGINYKSIKNFVIVSITQMSNLFSNALNSIQSDINNLDTRVTTLENKSSEWVEITSTNGQEAEITQEFTEIKMQARGAGTLYSVTCNYDSIIFHNSTYDAPTYIIAGNPIENNYGCKFKYMLSNGKQYVCVDKCFSGGNQEGIECRAWIKPVPTGTQ